MKLKINDCVINKGQIAYSDIRSFPQSGPWLFSHWAPFCPMFQPKWALLGSLKDGIHIPNSKPWLLGCHYLTGPSVSSLPSRPCVPPSKNLPPLEWFFSLQNSSNSYCLFHTSVIFNVLILNYFCSPNSSVSSLREENNFFYISNISRVLSKTS